MVNFHSDLVVAMSTTAALSALSPLDGRYATRTEAMRNLFSEHALIRHRIFVEVEWLKMLDTMLLSSIGSNTWYATLGQCSLQMASDIKTLETRTHHDVKAVEYFLKERIDNPRLREHVHFGCTSEDVNNLAYGLMLKSARTDILLPQLDHIIKSLSAWTQQYAHLPMLSRTHGQPASPTTLGKEMANVMMRLSRQRHQFNAVTLLGKMNGAVGNYNAHTVAYPDVDWPAVAKQFVRSLGLDWNPYTTQIEPHDSIAEYCHALVRCNTILLDFARDIWGYVALGYFDQRVQDGEVGSSTMPHKVNPIDFENAEGNLGLANALLQHLANKLPISRWQRDLSDSTVFRNLGVAFGHCSLAYQTLAKGLTKLSPNKARLAQDLNACWNVLAEPIQMTMRRYGIPHAYEQLKDLTRGNPITKALLHAFIETLPLPHSAKTHLLALTPASYLGEAPYLAERSVKKINM